MKISFYGAAGEVTGSCYLVETEQVKFLVDCGMFQGAPETEARNRRSFPFEARHIDFVLLTHAHIDHSGLLPRLVLAGFKGPIYTTTATADLLAVMLPDSGHLQEMEAERTQRYIRRGGKPRYQSAEPLYTVRDALRSLEQIEALAYDHDIEPHPAVRCRFRDAGHILGSAIIEVWVQEGYRRTKLVFSGDLGQPNRPILRDPTIIERADILLVESTYGNRLHKDMKATLDEFVTAVNDTLLRKHGNVIIPAFAVGRTQELLYHFHELTRQGRFKNLNIFVDSPMATEVTRITMQHMQLFDAEAKELAAWRAAGHGLPVVKFTGSVEESMALNNIHGGVVIISASGMCDGGRIKHHLRHNLGRRENSILITGFQAEGTLGRRLVDQAESVRIFGQDVPVRADIYTLGGFSAHADQAALLRWLRAFREPPRRTFVVHGESATAEIFAATVGQELGWKVQVPSRGEHVMI
ncbi:MBL fold metallo-hydrolase RNA specificity domain-containing protein [Sulfurivermis fontis]|uniref:MBL fold metallo-hydrolase RNA specificity domain-containing protein n=1 Tax=Sulfurivermis fontis TaxID=1972068 RepID=UPI000FDBBD8B|nr:MBL fold metallo-hydrolase [Sulfurivermis fontis]